MSEPEVDLGNTNLQNVISEQLTSDAKTQNLNSIVEEKNNPPEPRGNWWDFCI